VDAVFMVRLGDHPDFVRS